MKVFFKRVLLAFLSLVFLTGVFICTQKTSEPNDNCFLITASAASIRLNKSSITLVKGTEYALKIKGTKAKVKWTSSNKDVASVTQKGIVVAKSKGIAKIKARVAGEVYSCKVKVESPKISQKSLVLIKGTSSNLKIVGTSLKVEWKSSDPTIASVSSKGKVKARKAGCALISGVVAGKSYSCKIKVEAPNISKTSLVLINGTSYALNMTGTTLATNWKSSDPSIASVSEKGIVLAKNTGSAIITATVQGRAYSCRVTVETPKISNTDANIQVGEKIALSVTGTSFIPTWKSSDSSVATVDPNGVVTAEKIGNTTITATINSTNLSCNLVVRDLDKIDYNKSLYSSETLEIKLKNSTKEYITFSVFNNSDGNIHLYWDYIVINGVCYYDDLKSYYSDIDFEFSVIPKGVTEDVKFFVNRTNDAIDSLSGQFYTCEAPTGNCICLQYFNYNNSIITEYYSRETLKAYSTEVYNSELITIRIIGATDDGLLFSVTNKTDLDYSLHYERMSINGNKIDDESDFNMDHIAKNSTAVLVLSTATDCSEIQSLSGLFTLAQFPSGIIDDYPYISVDNPL